jgi:hypothetical protein
LISCFPPPAPRPTLLRPALSQRGTLPMSAVLLGGTWEFACWYCNGNASQINSGMPGRVGLAGLLSKLPPWAAIVPSSDGSLVVRLGSHWRAAAPGLLREAMRRPSKSPRLRRLEGGVFASVPPQLWDFAIPPELRGKSEAGDLVRVALPRPPTIRVHERDSPHIAPQDWEPTLTPHWKRTLTENWPPPLTKNWRPQNWDDHSNDGGEDESRGWTADFEVWRVYWLSLELGPRRYPIALPIALYGRSRPAPPVPTWSSPPLSMGTSFSSPFPSPSSSPPASSSRPKASSTEGSSSKASVQERVGEAQARMGDVLQALDRIAPASCMLPRKSPRP